MNNIGRLARSIETGWLGKIQAVESQNGEEMYKMQGVNTLCLAIAGGVPDDHLDDDDIQWFAPADVKLVQTPTKE